MYYLGKKLSIGKSLVLFKGRLNFKQYIKTKRARFGIKLFQLCTSDGIILDYIIYHGNMAPQLAEMEENYLNTDRILGTPIWEKVTICTLTTTTLQFLLCSIFYRMALMLLEQSEKLENISHRIEMSYHQ